MHHPFYIPINGVIEITIFTIVLVWLLYNIHIIRVKMVVPNYHPRPILVFGYYRFLCLSVCPGVLVCVYKSLVCPRDNSGLVQARITKCDQRLKITCLRSLLLWRQSTLNFNVKLNLKSKFTAFWGCSHHNSSPVEARITKFERELVIPF